MNNQAKPSDSRVYFGYLRLLVICAFVCFLSSCDRGPALFNKSNPQSNFFTEPTCNKTIRLISKTECEIKVGHDTFLAGYTQEGNKLRIVERAMGTDMVIYFDIVSDGLRDVSSPSDIYLLPDALKKHQDCERAAKIAEEKRQEEMREASIRRQNFVRQQFLKREADLKERLILSRDAVMKDVKKFLFRGAVFTADYASRWGYQHKNPNLPFQVIITGDPVIENFDYDEQRNGFSKNSQRGAGDVDQVFAVPAHFRWLGETETLSPSSWGGKIMDYDGMFIGGIKAQNKNSPNPVWRVTMKYCIQDHSFPQKWVSRDDGCIWNGSQFEGKGQSAVKLIKP